jgi:folate-binding protein YgfZ
MGKKFADYQIADAASYDRHRLALGVPDGSRDMIVGKSTLSDGNFDFLNGVSWTKGCYVGQELTARMHHRALVKKRMFPVKISEAAPATGSIVYLNNDEVGEMRSSNGGVGLALLNIEQAKWAIKEGLTLDCESTKLTPTQPDWLKV